MSLSPASEVVSVRFSLLSPDEILKNSVCKVTSGDRFNTVRKKKLQPIDVGEVVTLDDERMGPTDNNKECITCGGDNETCPGHYGHIELNTRIIHPLKPFQKLLCKLLSCFCHRCSSLLMTQDYIGILGIEENLKMHERFDKIQKSILKFNSCHNCKTGVRKYSHVKEKIMVSIKDSKCELLPDEIYDIFKDVKDDDLRLLGLDPQAFHPKWLILSVLPVIPPCSRPPVMMDGQKSDDDLTNIYASIINTNNKLLNVSTGKEKDELTNMLGYYIKVLMDNSRKTAKHSNGRPKKGIKERLSGKPGLFRSGALGKRVM